MQWGKWVCVRGWLWGERFTAVDKLGRQIIAAKLFFGRALPMKLTKIHQKEFADAQK
jgi:hypothetical protein